MTGRNSGIRSMGDSTQISAMPTTILARRGTLGSARSRRTVVAQAGRNPARSLSVPSGRRAARTTSRAHVATSAATPTTSQVHQATTTSCHRSQRIRRSTAVVPDGGPRRWTPAAIEDTSWPGSVVRLVPRRHERKEAAMRDHYLPGVPCWVDTGHPDPDAAAEFYRGIFGWEL